MSDVEKQIEQWRAGLAGSETLGNADIRELESHLREEIDHLKSLSLSGDEAFCVARHRLGDAVALDGEFAKLRPHQWLIHRLCWAITGVLLYVAATEFASMTFCLSLKLGHMAGLRQTALGLLAGMVQIAGFAGPILLAVWLYTRHSHPRANGQVGGSKAAPILAAVALVIGTWVFFVAGRLLTILFFRTVEQKDFAAAMPAGALVSIICHLAVPALLAGLFVALYLRSKREVQVQQ
jgi:hypothetical protein